MNQAPQINLNGTDKQALIDPLMVAYLAARKTSDMLRLCTPHGRDYQTLPVGAYEIARNQHIARMKASEIIANELLDLIEQIHAQ